MQIEITTKTNTTTIETSENWTAIEDKRRIHVFSRFPLSFLVGAYDPFQFKDVTDFVTCSMLLDLVEMRKAA